MAGLKEAGCTLLELDVTSQASVATAVELVLQEAGRIDVLVNNAGMGGRGPVCDYSIEDAKRVFDVNYFGTMAMCQVCGLRVARCSGSVQPKARRRALLGGKLSRCVVMARTSPSVSPHAAGIWPMHLKLKVLEPPHAAGTPRRRSCPAWWSAAAAPSSTSAAPWASSRCPSPVKGMEGS
jgi:NAD(P)-dependent dehydrogenase (short-subunit alcohol dehydrogenase family)